MTPGGAHGHTVVFDVNVYLDVASLLGPPFSWGKFDAAAVSYAGAPVPHPQERRADSVRALALCVGGVFAAGQPLQVWTSDHIDGLVVHKAKQPDDPALRAEDRGLGWSQDDADDLLDDLVRDLVYDLSKGGQTVVTIPAGDPPLSHEDGFVFRSALSAGDGSPFRYCVTGDKDFRDSGPALPGDVAVLYPHEWVALVRQARQRMAVRGLRRQDKDTA